MIAEELKNTKIKDLAPVAEKLRERLVETVRRNGGHLSSNLGAVELTLALCRAFDFPKDKIVFDVGHQSYVYKLLSGRDLDRLRRKGGESGFPDPQESEDDCFLAGHSGTSVAAGIGLCNARDARGEDFYVVSVIGDASLGNGLALEAVFSSENKPKKFVVVLNDNGMSIGKNTSALYRALSKATAKAGYRRVDRFLDRTFKTTSAFGRQLRRIKYSIKGWLNKNDFFERCGFKYIGPVDGHDLHELCGILADVKKLDRPVFLHVVTQKGRGYAPAEADPSRYHGVGKNFAVSENTFSTALGRLLLARAESDPSLVAVTAAMTDGVGLSAFAEKYPDRLYDVGICEEYAVTMAAGMAKGGLSPVVCVYSTFLQRAFDEIVHDVCLQNLPVIFCADRAGFVGADGKTHQGLLDVLLRAVPNLSVFQPKDAEELADVFDYARSPGGPALIRYPNGYSPNLGSRRKISAHRLWEVLSEGKGAVVLASGARSVARALEAKKLSGEDVMVVNCRSVKPLDEGLLKEIAGRDILTYEEGYAACGFGSAVAEFYACRGEAVRLLTVAAPECVVAHATADEQAEQCRLTASDLAAKIRAFSSRA